MLRRRRVGRQGKRLGIIICDRYHNCAGGKCLRALRTREGALAHLADTDEPVDAAA